MEIKQKPTLAQSLKVIHSVVNLEFISFISAGETKKRVQDTNFSFSVFSLLHSLQHHGNTALINNSKQVHALINCFFKNVFEWRYIITYHFN